jgi:hypothetical protein
MRSIDIGKDHLGPAIGRDRFFINALDRHLGKESFDLQPSPPDVQRKHGQNVFPIYGVQRLDAF